MLTSDFDYPLPEALIAQRPVEPRDSCRLLCMSRGDGTVSHAVFRDLPALFREGDRLVFNNTRVMPARIFVRKPTGGRCEIFFLEAVHSGCWKALVKPGSNAPGGAVLHLEDAPEILLRIAGILPAGERLVTVDDASVTVTVEEVMERYGHIPLPHYIGRDDGAEDRDDYQTVYAEVPGAVAAPTAGLHFTDTLMETLAARGIGLTNITLHVGIGTFRPVKVEQPKDHEMHEERYVLTAGAVREIEATKKAGGRIIAVGTTVVRVLEHCFAAFGGLHAHEGSTKIMITPPWRFGIIDGLITNFHLPRSTLLMLVSAFGGHDYTMTAYREAVDCNYRFYSYGDAMFII